MCGIAGFVDRSITPSRASETLEQLTKVLRHRGPDASDRVVIDDEVALGHCRLAILDLTPTGAQPMTSRSGTWTIAFNGEIYNHEALRVILRGRGIRLKGRSDTEVLLEAIEELGLERTLEHSNGMFAFAAFDRRSRRLVVARDRLGEKPVYWHRSDGRFAFASELRALRLIPGIPLEVDPAAATALLRWSFIPHPHTIYRDVRQLSPGTYLDVDLSGSQPQVRERQWWSFTEVAQNAMTHRGQPSIESAAEELSSLLAEAVSLRLESDVTLGAFLSGGIDSSLVAAFAQQALGERRLKTFTVSMPDLGYDESGHAAVVARHLGTDHHEVHLSRADALAVVPRLASIWDEPFADPSMLPTALVCSAARKELTVCLGGDGGDEMFAGYNRHSLGAALHDRTRRIPARVRSLLAARLLAVSPATIDRLARVVPERRRPPLLGDKVHKGAALLAAGGSAWDELASVWPLSDLGVAPHHPDTAQALLGLDPLESMLAADTASVLPDQMMVKVDRASMASSLEVRTPLLDHHLLEWSWRQPREVKTADGIGKLVLRRVAQDMLPAPITRRPKMGFDPPLADWLRTDLRPWASELLESPRSSEHGWIDGAAVQQAWREHLSGRRNHDYRLWSVLMLEAWLNEHHPA